MFSTKHVMLLAIIGLAGCASTHVDSKTSSQPLSLISEIKDVCDLYKRSYNGCTELSQKNVTIEGTIYFPKSNEYQPQLFPAGIRIPSHGNDQLWSDDTLPNPIDLRTTDLTKRQRKLIHKYHMKSVVVEATTNSECVTAHAGNPGYIEETNEVIMIMGYCHTQGSVYLSDFKISTKKAS